MVDLYLPFKIEANHLYKPGSAYCNYYSSLYSSLHHFLFPDLNQPFLDAISFV